MAQQLTSPGYYGLYDGIFGRFYSSQVSVSRDARNEPILQEQVIKNARFCYPNKDEHEVYFFAYDISGSLIGRCDVVPMQGVKVLNTQPAPTMDLLLPRLFFAIHNRVLGKVYQSQGELYAEPFLSERSYIPRKELSEVYFVRSFLTEDPGRFSVEESVTILDPALLEVFTEDLTGLRLRHGADGDRSDAVGAVSRVDVISRTVRKSVEFSAFRPARDDSLLPPRQPAPHVTRNTTPSEHPTTLVAVVTGDDHSVAEATVVVSSSFSASSAGIPRPPSRIKTPLCQPVPPPQPPHQSVKVRATRTSTSRGGGELEVAVSALISERLSEGDRIFFNATWALLKKTTNWSAKWKKGATEELFVAPLGDIDDSRLEGIQYFLHKAGFLKHLKNNPCLHASWGRLQRMLCGAGWRVDRAEPDSSRSFVFAAAEEAGCAIDGVHRFHSRAAMLKFVHRFPYLLQTDAQLGETLTSAGWSSTAGELKGGAGGLWRSPDEQCDSTRKQAAGRPLSEVRRDMWLRPVKYLRCVPSVMLALDQPILDSELLASVQLPARDNQPPVTAESDTEAEEFFDEEEEDEAQEEEEEESDISQSGDNDGDSDGAEQVVPPAAPGRARKTDPAVSAYRIRRFTAEASADSFDRAEFMELLGRLGWKWETADFSSAWWRRDFVLRAPWFDLTRADKMQAGLDFFFDQADVFRYIQLRGHRGKPRRPIPLEKDLTSREYNLNRRVHELAQQSSPSPWKCGLRDMLRDADWQYIRLAKANGLFSHVWVPHWSLPTFDEDMLTTHRSGHDFFANEDEVLRYLREFGNVNCDAPLTAGSGSAQASPCSEESVPPLPDTPRSQLQHYTKYASQLYRPDTLTWELLRSAFNWRHVSTSPSLFRENSVYLAPWAVQVFEEGGGKRDPSLLILRRDYFYDTKSVFRFVAKYGNAPTEQPPTPEEEGRRAKRKAEPVQSKASSSTAANGGAEQQQEPVVASRQERKQTVAVSRPPSAAKKPRQSDALVPSLSRVEERLRPLVVDLLDNLGKGDDLRLPKCVLPVAKAHGLQWFYYSANCLSYQLYTFQSDLRTAKDVPRFVEGRDFFLGQDDFMRHMLGQLAMAGYDGATNTAPAGVSAELATSSDDDDADSPSQEAGAATPHYSLRPPLELRPRAGRQAALSSGGIIDRYMHGEDPPAAAASPFTDFPQQQSMSEDSRPSSSRKRRSEGPATSASKAGRTVRATVAKPAPSSASQPTHSTAAKRGPSGKKTKANSASESSSSAGSAEKPVTAVAGLAEDDMTLGERFDQALRQLLPSAQDVQIVAREEQRAKVEAAVTTALTEGSGAGLYLCGMSGVGKTAVVEAVLSQLRRAKEDGQLDCEIIRVTGTALGAAFSSLADLMNCRDGKSTDEAAVMRRLTPNSTQTDRKNSKVYPFHVLFIDEIDKAQKSAVRRLYEACNADNSRLILIGLANDISFPRHLGISVVDEPQTIVFPALQKDQMRAILVSRTAGLLNKFAVDLLAGKATKMGGDCRRLLDLARGTIQTAMQKECWASKLGEVVAGPIVDQKDVVSNFQDVGVGASRVPQHLASMPQPARTLMVAMVLDRFNKRDRTMKFPDIIRAVNSYMDELHWPNYSREEARSALEVLANYGLVVGGPSLFMAKLDFDKYNFEVVPTMHEMLRVPDMEPKHKAALERAVKDADVTIQHPLNC